jgi:hypothetical protein
MLPSYILVAPQKKSSERKLFGLFSMGRKIEELDPLDKTEAATREALQVSNTTYYQYAHDCRCCLI